MPEEIIEIGNAITDDIIEITSNESADIVEIISDDTSTLLEIVDASPVSVIEIIGAGIVPGPKGDTGDTGPPSGSGGASGYTTLLSITGTKETASIYSITSSGVNYTHSGSDGEFPEAEQLFNTTSGVLLFLNGVNLYKGTAVLWNSTTSFILNSVVDNGDEILIIS